MQQTVMVDASVCVPCGHSFSEVGITSWLKRNSECPVCRVVVRFTSPNFALRDLILHLFADALVEDLTDSQLACSPAEAERRVVDAVQHMRRSQQHHSMHQRQDSSRCLLM